MANHILTQLIETCDGNTGELLRRRHVDSKSAAPSIGKLIETTTRGDGGTRSGGHLSWTRGLDILRESKLAGVRLTPELLVLLLSKVPPGNSRKVSFHLRLVCNA